MANEGKGPLVWIQNAAVLSGFSIRHFRRVVKEERIRTVQIGKKIFLVGVDFRRWQANQKPKIN